MRRGGKIQLLVGRFEADGGGGEPVSPVAEDGRPRARSASGTARSRPPASSARATAGGHGMKRLARRLSVTAHTAVKTLYA